MGIDRSGTSYVRHSYRNYAHLEGSVQEDAVILTDRPELTVHFRLLVEEPILNRDGRGVSEKQLFDVEVEKRFASFAATLRKGTIVMIDAKLRLESSTNNGVHQQTVTLLAHRIHSLNYNKEAPASLQGA